MYPEQLVAPMRSDLTVAGFKELKSAEAVDQEFKDQKGKDFVFQLIYLA